MRVESPTSSRWPSHHGLRSGRSKLLVAFAWFLCGVRPKRKFDNIQIKPVRPFVKEIVIRHTCENSPEDHWVRCSTNQAASFGKACGFRVFVKRHVFNRT